jgi:hypothetical protein
MPWQGEKYASGANGGRQRGIALRNAADLAVAIVKD